MLGCDLSCSENILISEEKQRILLLERVIKNTSVHHITYLSGETQSFAVYQSVESVVVSDFTHEGRRKQAPQSKTGESMLLRAVQHLRH